MTALFAIPSCPGHHLWHVALAFEATRLTRRRLTNTFHRRRLQCVPSAWRPHLLAALRGGVAQQFRTAAPPHREQLVRPLQPARLQRRQPAASVIGWGPYVTAATADDPDDGDALAGLLSAGDQLRLIFSAPTSMPLPLDASRLITVLLDGNPFDVGTWSGNWTSADVLTLTFAPQTSTNAAALPLLADLSARLKIRCSAVSNITTPALPSGAPTSLACGQALPPGSQSPPPPVPIIGDFGAPVPTISVATSYDPDDRDAIFSVGDVIALIFPRPTDMGGHAANEVLSMENVSRLFQFSPDLPAGTLFAASWTDPATFNLTILNVTSTAPAVSLSPPTRVQCRCGAPNGPNRCRDSDGIHYTEAHLGGASELSCGTGFVDFRNGANWGLRPGPSLLSVVANDPDDADAVFADADTITLNFNEPTDAAGFSVGATIPKAELDQLFSFTPNLGRNYIGTWTTSSQIVITIVDASGHGVPAITYTTALRIRCGVTRPIRDLARRNLPSTWIAPCPILGSCGELLPPAVATVLADDPDDGDGVLSFGDVITIRFGRATDRAGAGAARLRALSLWQRHSPRLMHSSRCGWRLQRTHPRRLHLCPSA